MNQERIRGIKKRLKELEKIEEEKESAKEEQTDKKDDKDNSDKDSDNEAEGEGDKTEKEKTSDKDDKSEKSEKSNEDENDKTSKKDSEKGSEESDTESKSKITKTNQVSDSVSKSLATGSKNVKFTDKGSNKDDSDSGSDSEEETDPIKIEKKKLEKDLDKYENYGYKETHDEIMNHLEIHDHNKYRLKAKGVLVVPFFMKGKYGKPRKTTSQQQISSVSSNDGKSELKEKELKEMKKRKIYHKERMERIKQFKIKTRNQGGFDQGNQFNTMSPSGMSNKLNLNANLLNQNKTKIVLKPQTKMTQKVTLESLHQMNLKDFNNRRQDDFKPKDVIGSEFQADDDSSVFNYFFPENK